jgi:hypothetical protein
MKDLQSLSSYTEPVRYVLYLRGSITMLYVIRHDLYQAKRFANGCQTRINEVLSSRETSGSNIGQTTLYFVFRARLKSFSGGLQNVTDGLGEGVR